MQAYFELLSVVLTNVLIDTVAILLEQLFARARISGFAVLISVGGRHFEI